MEHVPPELQHEWELNDEYRRLTSEYVAFHGDFFEDENGVCEARVALDDIEVVAAALDRAALHEYFQRRSRGQ